MILNSITPMRGDRVTQWRRAAKRAPVQHSNGPTASEEARGEPPARGSPATVAGLPALRER